ncbi:GspH/FimT family pseudopilin [Chitiniphilus eburneus]|uniref:Type II secretion system protein H n=1 Tax=Chitiniphilus eburneus TaxID=2571148 RepID=A0A4U0Q8C6_9NEIS|nr:GspH/FimT family pseudopilin [Chitiniphilus eburneus]TJZ77509.1 type II secretion system protein GspH [Chitiniphilus eburneus]
MRQGGFTLIEVMVVIAIIGIVLGIAAPSYQSLVRNSRLSSASEELLTHLMLARTEAIKRNRSVDVCAADTSASSPECDSSRAWKDGWIVIVPGETQPLRIGTPVENIDALDVTGTTQNKLTFRSFTNASNQAATFTFCIAGVQAREVVVERSGRVSRLLGDTCAAD